MAYESVKNQIDAYIKANGVNLITGSVLNAVLTTMLDELGEGYAFQGVIYATDTPSPAADIPQAWLASAGTYIGGSITVDEGELALILHTADGWSKVTVYRGVQLSQEAIVEALGYTPADEANLAEKQDTIADLPAIRSGAALGSTSVQPADIENMVEAEPIGSIIPPVNPSQFATKEELSQLGELVEPIDENFDHVTKWAENRLNPATCASGLINSAGTIFTGGSYDSYTYTDFIRVIPGKTYSLQYGAETIVIGRQIMNISRHCFYDADKNRVSGSDSGAGSLTIPSGVEYVRFCFYKTLANITAQYFAFVEGITIKDFVPYEEDSYSLVLKAEANNTPYIEGIVEEKMDETKFGPENTDTSLGANAFDKDALVQGTNYWLNTFSWNGSDSANNAYFTALFSVKPNQQYLFWQGEMRVGVRSVNEYDADGNFISGTSVGNAYVVKTGADTAFIKCSFVTGAESVVKVEPIVQNGATVQAFLPSSLYCAVGRTIELYNSQVCLSEDCHIQWRIVNATTNSIRPLKRKLQVVGNATGEATVVLVVYDDNKNILFAGDTRFYFVNASLSTAKSIVPVGDSLTNSKEWLAEVERLSGNNINYVGEYSWRLKDADGNMQTGGHEGRSGFSAKDYATGAVYTYGGESTPNKWWNGNRFSLTAFENATSITPDIVQLWVGVNGLSENNEENANYIKTLVDNIRLDNASIPVFVCVTPFKGDQNAIGLQRSVDGFVAGVSAWKYNEDFKIMDLMKRLYTIFSFGYTNVHIIDLAIAMDSEYNYGWQEVAVNPRAVQTEHIQTDSVHPQTQGYYQIADILFSNYCAVLNA